MSPTDQDTTTSLTIDPGQPDHTLATPYADPDNPAYAYLASLGSQRTRHTMLDDLAIIAALLNDTDPADLEPADRRGLVFVYPWHQLEVTQVNAIRAALADRYKYNTANRMLSALRGVIRYCWKLEKITEEKRARLSDIDAVKGSSVPSGRDLSFTERAKLFEACAEDPTPAGARDAAILACADAGLRRAEIAKLDVENANLSEGWLFVRGKGNKEREVPLSPDGQIPALKDWLAVRGSEPGPLFWPINKGGKMTARRISSQAVYNVIEKRSKLAGVAEMTPHDFRRSAVGDLLDAGADIATVQKIMGHADPSTTARYDRRSKQAMKKAVSLRSSPYKGRRQQPLPAG